MTKALTEFLASGGSAAATGAPPAHVDSLISSCTYL